MPYGLSGRISEWQEHDAARVQGLFAAVLHFGSFITAVITFVAIAAAVFFFVVKPMDVIKKRSAKEEVAMVSDEERRHQELLAALRERN